MIWRVATLVARTQLTRGRFLALLAVGSLTILFGVGIALGDAVTRFSSSFDMLDNYGLRVAAPVISLVLASAALGDFVDDRTLVYMWLRPVPRWKLALGATLASLGTALPFVVIPVTIGAYIASGDSKMAVAAAVSSAIATLGYAALFLALGFKVRRALVWGLAYILIWEGFLARSVGAAAKLSIQIYSRTMFNRIIGQPTPSHGSSTVAAVVVPVAVAVIAIAATARWLHTTEVA